MNFAEVYVNKKIAPLDHTFIYEIPGELVGRVKVGTVVSAPFGHTTVKAVVTAILEDPGNIAPKYIDSIINEEFLFPKDLLELGTYIGDYYMNTTMSVFRAMIPGGIDIFGKIQKPKTQPWLKVAVATDPSTIKGVKQRELYAYLLEVGEVSQAEAGKALDFSASVLKGLIDKGLVVKENRRVRRYSYGDLDNIKAKPLELTLEQNNVLQAILHEPDPDNRPILLHGVTGSGKTEIYLRLAQEAYKNSRQTIILIPEIALTPQFVTLFEDRFPGEVAVMHSRLSSGERRDAWYGVQEGRAKIVLGPRSAIFAPTPDLGLIIMDEEHEASYEQENTPRFHTREVAIKRSQLSNALFVMGSATPSMETYEKAKNGEYRLFTMAHRVDDRPLPKVEIVDMRKELAEGWKEVLSRSLIRDMEDCLEQGNQAMLFLNRLGTRTFVSCRDCGFVYQCPHCGVSMVYYQSQGVMRCNRCDHREKLTGHCPQCGGKRIKYFGLGTEGLEAVVRKFFPNAAIDRLDSDTTKVKGDFDKIYHRMSQGETDILIGTKMIAKGWDFPRVTLTGIVAADLTLNFPDFRAGEQTFQSITQVSGRCGRGREPGKVVMQTYRPEEKVLQLGAGQDYQSFFQWEIENRKKYGYPPYSQSLRIVFTAPKGYFFQDDVNAIKRIFKESATGNTRVFGPVPAVYRYRREEEMWTLTLMGENLPELKYLYSIGIEKIKQEKLIDKTIKVQTEVNPIHII